MVLDRAGNVRLERDNGTARFWGRTNRTQLAVRFGEWGPGGGWDGMGWGGVWGGCGCGGGRGPYETRVGHVGHVWVMWVMWVMCGSCRSCVGHVWVVTAGKGHVALEGSRRTTWKRRSQCAGWGRGGLRGGVGGGGGLEGSDGEPGGEGTNHARGSTGYLQCPSASAQFTRAHRARPRLGLL